MKGLEVVLLQSAGPLVSVSARGGPTSAEPTSTCALEQKFAVLVRLSTEQVSSLSHLTEPEECYAGCVKVVPATWDPFVSPYHVEGRCPKQGSTYQCGSQPLASGGKGLESVTRVE